MSRIIQSSVYAILILLTCLTNAHGQDQITLNPTSDQLASRLFEQAHRLRFVDPDSSLILAERCYELFSANQDTLNLVAVLRQQATVHGHNANYKDSYDRLWQALLLTDRPKWQAQQASIYLDLGRYFSFLKREEKAIAYFNRALDINRQLVKSNLLQESALTANFYSYVSTYRELNKPELGRQYLDSCKLYLDPAQSSNLAIYLEFETAYLHAQKGELAQAIRQYERLVPRLQQQNPSYQVLLYTYLGDAYLHMKDLARCEKLYLSALEFSRKYQSHHDFTPLIHERLAYLYQQQDRHELAFESLRTAKELDRQYFDARSENNRPLLEVLDAYNRTKEEQRQFLQEQKMRDLEQEERVLFLQRTILLIGIGTLLLLGYLYLKYLRSKHRTEKKLIQHQKELELQKANEILDLKNRELSTSTLKLIEKDEFIANLKSKLSGGDGTVNVNEIKRILQTMSAGNDQNWEEFEARFISVNKGFYERLKKQFPKLTQGDLRLSALIKLNFSSKDMARLLGISVESVHTTRYRLRKKLGLTRDVNLAEFIAQI